jgi:peptidoglycan/xylan/chitin deacetylase (PgdA/CDA1 family)
VIPLLAAVLAGFLEPGVYRCPGPDTSSTTTPSSAPDRIPILCYHSINSSGRLSVSPWRFRSDLEDLYSEGFYLITPDDLQNGLSRLPEGRSPVMVTFDDGWQSQFNYLTEADGSLLLDQQCALGILESFYEEHPDFGRGAVFNISWDKTPFGQGSLIEDKFNFLLDNGYCIGNHSLKHRSLIYLGADSWDDSITGALDRFERYLGLRTGEVDTMAWPGGRIPEGSSTDERLSSIGFRGRAAVSMGFSVDGALADLGSIGSLSGRLRLGRIDMGLYSTSRLFSHGGYYQPAEWRSDLHSPMPFRLVPPEPGLPL